MQISQIMTSYTQPKEQRQPRSQGSLSTSRKYPGYSWSRDYACQRKPYPDSILPALSGELNVALLYRRYFEKEASYLSEILPDQCFVST